MILSRIYHLADHEPPKKALPVVPARLWFGDVVAMTPEQLDALRKHPDWTEAT